MTPERNRIYHGDCRHILASFDEAWADSIVTDPPYELGFMGKSWDRSGVAYDVETWRQALRALKPGGFLIAFGGTRTYHRMACAIEDAGFEVRDMGAWLYGEGFPKSLNVAKAIASGSGRPEDIRRMEMGGEYEPSGRGRVNYDHGTGSAMNGKSDSKLKFPPEAEAWLGWGTALKPAQEPFCIARKPLSEKNLAENVLKHGTGGINIDASRIGTTKDVPASAAKDRIGQVAKGDERGRTMESSGFDPNVGRWPANLITMHHPLCVQLDTCHACVPDCPMRIMDTQSGAAGGSGPASGPTLTEGNTSFSRGKFNGTKEPPPFYGDTGGASRFFYCAKPSQAERNMGLAGLSSQKRDLAREAGKPGGENPRNRGAKEVQNFHPTVKPVDLMVYLMRLVTPRGGGKPRRLLWLGVHRDSRSARWIRLGWHREDGRVHPSSRGARGS